MPIVFYNSGARLACTCGVVVPRGLHVYTIVILVILYLNLFLSVFKQKL